MNIRKRSILRKTLLGSSSGIALYHDFTTGVLPNYLTVSRLSQATAFDSTGSLVYGPNNQQLYSEDPTNGSGWATDNVTVALSSATSPPSGVSTLATVNEGTNTTSHRSLAQNQSIATGETYQASIYVKNIDRQYVQLGFSSSAWGAVAYVNFDLVNITVGTVGAGISNYGIVDVGNGWRRLWATSTATSSSGAANWFLALITGSIDARAASYTGTNKSVYETGAQLAKITSAQASALQSYNPTTSAAYYGPRFDYDPSTLAAKGLLLEGARTNSIRNNTMVGASAGTPGTLPTNWSSVAQGALTQTVVGTGTESGISYIEIRVSGTANATGVYVVYMETTTGAAFTQNQVASESIYLRSSAGSTANINSFSLFNDERNGAGAFLITGSTSITAPTSAALRTYRPTFVRAVTSATAAFLVPGFAFSFSSGAVIDITLRIGIPQLELLSSATQTASSPILTSGSALTRAADIATFGGMAALILASAMGTVIPEVILAAAPNGVFGRLIGGSSNVPLFVDTTTGAAGTYNGSITINSASAATWTTGARGAIAWDSSGRSLASTGKAIVSDSGLIGTIGPFYLGSSNGGFYADGWYSKIAFSRFRLSNTELARRVVMGTTLQ